MEFFIAIFNNALVQVTNHNTNFLASRRTEITKTILGDDKTYQFKVAGRECMSIKFCRNQTFEIVMDDRVKVYKTFKSFVDGLTRATNSHELNPIIVSLITQVVLIIEMGISEVNN